MPGGTEPATGLSPGLGTVSGAPAVARHTVHIVYMRGCLIKKKRKRKKKKRNNQQCLARCAEPAIAT